MNCVEYRESVKDSKKKRNYMPTFWLKFDNKRLLSGFPCFSIHH